MKASNRRNYFFLMLLVLFAFADACVHAGALQIIDVPPQRGIQLALGLLLVIIAVMGGRVIPMFTNNGVPGASAIRYPWLERLAIGSLVALVVADATGAPAMLTATVALAAAVAHAARWLLWQPWLTLRVPLVWILHGAYAWIPVHLALRVASEAGWIAPSVATHALTAGAIGGLTIGMMTRTARGHTGRLLRADRWEVACYVAVLVAALARVFGPLLLPQHYLLFVLASAVLWVFAFGTYAVRYWPVLARSRLDGRPG